jgi:hypothetical protein
VFPGDQLGAVFHHCCGNRGNVVSHFEEFAGGAGRVLGKSNKREKNSVLPTLKQLLWETFRYVKNGALKGKFSMCIEILFDMES